MAYEPKAAVHVPYMDSSSFANIPSLTFRYDCSRIFGL